MARDEQSQLTGDGWSTVDFDVVGPYRWMTATESVLVMPVTVGGGDAHSRCRRCDVRIAGGPTMMAASHQRDDACRRNQCDRAGTRTSGGFPQRAAAQGTNEMAVVSRPTAPDKSIAVAT